MTSSDGARARDSHAALTPKGRRTRRSILDAALRLFAASGTNAVSLRAIAGEAGISLAGLLRYFTDRDELVVAALLLRDSESTISALGYDRVDPEDLATPHRVFVEYVRAVARNESQPGLVAVFSKAAAEATSTQHAAHALFRDRYARLRTALEASFAAHFSEIGSTEDPAWAAISLMAVTDGAQIQWLFQPRPGGLVEPVRALLHGYGIDVEKPDLVSAASPTSREPPSHSPRAWPPSA